jgi:hypothetical protein
MAKGKHGGNKIPVGEDHLYYSRLQLAEAYHTTATTIGKRLGGTPPAAQRNGGGVWKLIDVTTMMDIRKPVVAPVISTPDLITDPDDMAPADRRLHYQAEDLKQAAQIKARRNEIESGQLLEAGSVERVLAQAFKVLALTLDTLPDLLERDGLIQTSDVERIVEIVDNSRAQLAGDLASMSPDIAQMEEDGEW